MNERTFRMRAAAKRDPLALRTLDRALIGTALFLLMLLLGVHVAGATEIIPSLGITRSVDTGDNSSKVAGGLALRGNVLPFVMAEIGGSYRSEERFDGDLRVKQWPITASLWLKPLPILYAGGGAGWYHTTLDYEDSSPFEDETNQQFGVHLGGGLRLPLLPMLGLDLNGRYVFLDDLDQKISTEKLDPDFWTTSIGLAIKF